MEMSDIQTLLEKYYKDGFSTDCLCKATSVSHELVEKAYRGELEPNESFVVKPVLFLLTQLYLCDVTSSRYLNDVTCAMCEHYRITKRAIATYLGISLVEMDTFLESPDKFENGCQLTTKLLHLYMALVREK